VLGVLPYSTDLRVPAEDSLALDRAPEANARTIDVAVVRYPRMSNFDDFEPLAALGVGVRFIGDPSAVGAPDLLVLPGSKSTIADLAWLRQSGIAARLRALADAGIPILGICGGFQMLGETIRDPYGVDGAIGRTRGLGILPVTTRYATAKRAAQASGRIVSKSLFGAPGAPLVGYEIHYGLTCRRGARPLAELVRVPSGGRVLDGAVSADGLVVGTYLHGLFENEQIVQSLLAGIAARRGLPHPAPALPSDRYAGLSRWIRANADVQAMLGWL
jgi:adenosylcobyric acid synthase